MNWIRNFSAGSPDEPRTRDLEDAPQAMRQELIDLFFSLSEHNQDEISPEHIYRVTCQSLGIASSGMPHGGFRHATGRDVKNIEWARVYDLISRLWKDFELQGFGGRFREGVNRILAGYGVAWDLDEFGRLCRVIPTEARAQVQAAITELSDPKFKPALDLFNAARNHYDARPRRDRDSCSNMFDSLESVSKEKVNMPHATFGQVMAHARQHQLFNEQICGVLDGINTLRNRNFGHGMTTPFNLTRQEVDFTYTACVGGILLFARMT